MADIAIAARSLRRAPLTTGVAVVTIGLGIGAVTTLFSVFDAGPRYGSREPGSRPR